MPIRIFKKKDCYFRQNLLHNMIAHIQIIFFDFQQFLTCFRENNSYYDILSLLSIIQPYYKHTDKMFSVLDLYGTTGLSIYIPNNYEQRRYLHTYYATLDWAKDSNAIILFE